MRKYKIFLIFCVGLILIFSVSGPARIPFINYPHHAQAQFSSDDARGGGQKQQNCSEASFSHLGGVCNEGNAPEIHTVNTGVASSDLPTSTAGDSHDVIPLSFIVELVSNDSATLNNLIQSLKTKLSAAGGSVDIVFDQFGSFGLKFNNSSSSVGKFIEELKTNPNVKAIYNDVNLTMGD